MDICGWERRNQRKAIRENCIVSTSKRSMQSVSNVPTPVIHLMASAACMQPRMPGTTPNGPEGGPAGCSTASGAVGENIGESHRTGEHGHGLSLEGRYGAVTVRLSGGKAGAVHKEFGDETVRRLDNEIVVRHYIRACFPG